jgi:hypothetical protein
MKKVLIGVVIGIGLLVAYSQIARSQPAAQTQVVSPKAINTGGPNGSYHKDFCPPLVPVLANAYFQGYQCTNSGGTIANIGRVLAQPTNIGFAQFDVLAREMLTKPELSEKITVVRSDIACEGLWMITKNPDLDFGRILGLARRMRFILPATDSGSTASFNYLRQIDPEGLGRAADANITHLADATKVIEYIAASTQGEVGFFVQFADPRNANIKRLMDKKNGIRILPVLSREIIRAKVGDTAVYQAASFTMEEGGVFGSPTQITTACTQVALITGHPSNFADRNGQDDAKDMIQRLGSVGRDAFMPADNWMAGLLRGTRWLKDAALEGALAAVDTAKQAASKM